MNDLEEIKQKIDIVDLVGQYLTLKKAGANYKAPCPFHHEKSPSFMVSPEKQIFKCFGCGEAGDIFGFVMKMEGLEFVEALRMLADRAGIRLNKNVSKEEYKKEKDVKSRLYKINELSAKVFHKILLESNSGKLAKKYLEDRGIKAKAINDFILGYAPEKPLLREFLLKRGFSQNEIKLAGNPDKFFKRIMFPIFDVMGNVTGFTGRVLNSEIQPKYLNTTETPIFHKSRILYGLNIAKGEIKLRKSCIIVEGQMDVVLSHQAGVSNVVAASGTALTHEHLTNIARYTNNIVFSFDSDSAGSGAQKKAIELAIANDLNAKIIILPDGIKDPGEAVEKDAGIWQNVSQKTTPALDWIFNKTFKEKLNNKEFEKISGQDKKEIAKEILPFIKIIPDKIEQNHYLKLLAKKLQVSENIIADAFERTKIKTIKKEDANLSHKQLSLEESFVGLLLLCPEFLHLVASKVDYKDFSENSSKEIYKSLQSCYTKDKCEKKTCEGRSCQNFLKKNISSEYVEKAKFLLMAIEQENENSDSEAMRKEILDLANRIQNKKKEKIISDYANQIHNAEVTGDRSEVKKLLEEFQKTIGKK
jgi:DNA primase